MTFESKSPEQRADVRGVPFSEAIAMAFSAVPDGLGDRELGHVFATIEGRDRAFLDAFLEHGDRVVAAAGAWDVLALARNRAVSESLSLDEEGVNRLGQVIAGELAEEVLARPEINRMLPVYEQRRRCPECDAPRHHASLGSAFAWLDCEACCRRERLDGWRAWRAAIANSWQAEALAMVGGIHWPEKRARVGAVDRMLDEEHPSWSAYLYGPTGTGKTQQAAEAVRAMLGARLRSYGPGAYERFQGEVRKFPPIIFITEAELIDSLKPKRDLDGDAAVYIDAELLVLDDVGVARATAWAYEKLSAILDARYRSRALTLFTSNLSPAELRQRGVWDERMTSRIFQMCGGQEAHANGTLNLEEMTTNYRIPNTGGIW